MAETLGKSKPVNPDEIPEVLKSAGQESEAPKGDSPESLEEEFGLGRKNFFSKMSEQARAIAVSAYEGFKKIPGVDKVIGRLGISYNQFWINRWDKKAFNAKGKAESLHEINDDQITELNKTKKELESAIADLEKSGASNADSLKLRLTVLGKKMEELEAKNSSADEKFRRTNEKKEKYVTERNRIADKLIEKYEKSLKPLENTLEGLETERLKAELLTAAAEARYEIMQDQLERIEKQKERVKSILEQSGESERKIRIDGTIKELEAKLKTQRQKIERENENLERKNKEISERIDKVKSKADVYRQEKAEFEGVKKRGPGVIAPIEAKKQPEEAPLDTPEEIEEEESKEEQAKSISDLIARWNSEFKGDKSVVSNLPEFINSTPFLKAIKYSPDQKVTLKGFKKIVEVYFKLRKIPSGKFKELFNKFEKSMKNV